MDVYIIHYIVLGTYTQPLFLLLRQIENGFQSEHRASRHHSSITGMDEFRAAREVRTRATVQPGFLQAQAKRALSL